MIDHSSLPKHRRHPNRQSKLLLAAVSFSLLQFGAALRADAEPASDAALQEGYALMMGSGYQRERAAQDHVKGISSDANSKQAVRATMTALDKAIRLDAKSKLAYAVRARINFEMKDYKKAIDDYSKAIELEPKDFNLYKYRAFAYLRMGDWKKQMQDEAQAQSLVGKTGQKAVDYWSRLVGQDLSCTKYGGVNSHTDLGRDDEWWCRDANSYTAITSINGVVTGQDEVNRINEAIKRDPKHAAEQYVLLGRFYVKRPGEYDKALAAYNKAIGLDPKCLNAYLFRARYYRSMQEDTKAIDDYNIALRLDPRVEDAYVNLARIYGSEAQTEKAINQYDKVIKLYPQKAYLYVARGNAHRELILITNYYESARKTIEHYKSVMASSPNDFVTDWLDPLDMCQITIDCYRPWKEAFKSTASEFQKGLADYNKAIKMEPKNWQWYLARGKLYREIGQSEKAIEDYNAAIKLNPKHDENLFVGRASAYSDAAQYDKAITDYTEAARLSSDNAYAHIGRGLAYAKLNRDGQAVDDFRKAVQIEMPHL